MKQSTRNVWLQVITATLIIALLIFQGIWKRTTEIDSGYREVMGTFARVLVVASDKKSALNSIDAAMQAIERVDTLMSDYDPNSQLSQVNRDAFAAPVAVDPEVFEVLSAAVEVSRISGGAFDVTIGPIVQLWRQAKETGVVPTPDQLAQARAKVGYQHLHLDPQAKTVRFAVEGMFLDVGGIAKGYAIDKAVWAMKEAGALGGMVDIGGDLACFGTPIGKNPHWYIALQDPAVEENTLLRFKFDNQSVATSGDYRRFTILNGQKHSHIMNPTTADSVTDLSSVSIIASTAMQADALATAVSVLGSEKGLAMIETIPDVQAILIPSAQPDKMIFTSGIEPYLDSTPK